VLACACASLARAESAQSSAKSQLEQTARDDPTSGDEICRGSCECVLPACINRSLLARFTASFSRIFPLMCPSRHTTQPVHGRRRLQPESLLLHDGGHV
jgi:hypothetical protein